MENSLIIFSTGKCTYLIVNGKLYGDTITSLRFEHNAREKAKISIDADSVGHFETEAFEKVTELLNSTLDCESVKRAIAEELKTNKEGG